MFKADEASQRTSCWNRAYPDEMIFVLLERDESAPAAIRAWIAERIKRGKNHPGDAQLVEAEECAAFMEREQPDFRTRRGGGE